MMELQVTPVTELACEGVLIQRYLDVRCPQARARVLAHAGGWIVDVLHKNAPDNRHAFAEHYRGGCIKTICAGLLSIAGYKPQTDDNGKIYYG